MGHARGKFARAHLRTPLSHLGNGWTDFAEIWCIAQALAGICLNEATFVTPFHISGAAGEVLLKFGLWIGPHHSYVFYTSQRVHTLSASMCPYSVFWKHLDALY